MTPMEWKEDLSRYLKTKGYEMAVVWKDRTTVLIAGPEKLDSAIRQKIAELVPDSVGTEFLQGPLHSTNKEISHILKMRPCEISLIGKTRRLILNLITNEENEDEEVGPEQIAAIDQVLFKDPWPQAWKMFINGKEVLSFDRKAAAEVWKNTEQRQRQVISKDDLLNLHIELSRSVTLEEFLERV
jgi:hypothetical protein